MYFFLMLFLFTSRFFLYRKGGSPDKHVFYRASLLSLIFNIYQALNRNISVIKIETAPLCMTKD